MAIKKTTVAEKHAQEILRLKTQHQTEMDRRDRQVNDIRDEANARLRHERKGAFWQGAFLIGAPAIVIGLVIGAVIVFAATTATLPVAFEAVQRNVLMHEVIADRDARLAVSP